MPVSETANHWASHPSDSEKDPSKPEEKMRAACAEGNGIAEKETNAVNAIRLATFAVLVLVALTVSLLVYFHTKDTEEGEFAAQFISHGGKVVDSFRANAESRLAALSSFSASVTSYALHSNQSFPFVTLPDFERRAAFTLQLAQVLSIAVNAIVSQDNRAEWEAYSVLNQGWLAEGLSLQQAVVDEDENESVQQFQNQTSSGVLGEDVTSSLDIVPFIFSLEEGGTTSAYETGPGPFVPIWQIAPAIPLPSLINFNGLTHPTTQAELRTVLATGQRLVGPAADYSDDLDPSIAGRKALLNLFLNRWKSGGNDYEEGPVSEIYVPIQDRFGPNSTMAGVFSSTIYWQVYFTDILPETAQGVICVLENTCSQSFTYVINGAQASYLGQGDLHDPSYDEYMIETGFGAFIGRDNVAASRDGNCYYNVRAYPSKEMEELYITREPLYFTLTLVAVFVFTSLVFVAYDCLVQRRHTVVNKSALQSNAVVSSLFPEEVRSRLPSLYASKTERDAATKSMQHEKDDNDDSFDDYYDDSLPIADLYPNCTVLFADIAGFTAWSSNRSPTEVFKLLETMYGLFDKIAHKYSVFKIETIGDCYVAVTGLPKPQEIHAIIMCRFANACIVRMSQMMHVLVEKLGPDTANLSMRVGLHSGPVTAGVLRGEKARFQLFGDTVNTAARMESTGQKGRIHVSECTATLLINAGKQAWITARDELVQAKGKGEMQTYWVKPPDVGTKSTTTTSSGPSGRDLSLSQALLEAHSLKMDQKLSESKASAQKYEDLLDSFREIEVSEKKNEVESSPEPRKKEHRFV
jgi:class 3 adenylate cyclase